MDRMMLKFILLLLSFVHVKSQSNINVLQSVLNQFCSENPGACNTGNIPSPTNPPISTPSPFIPASQCIKCPNIDKCLAKGFDCNSLNTNARCKIPSGLGVYAQNLICGNGKITATCGDGSFVPVMTQIIVQCRDSNEVDSVMNGDIKKGIDGIGSIDNNGRGFGSGVYICEPNQSWRPLLNSPDINSLTKSCYFSGCGRLPLKSLKLAVDSSWTWVRGLYRKNDNKLICTATLISPNTAITAAHCVTMPNSAVLRPDWSDFYELELPSSQSTKMCNILVHPFYIPGRRSTNDVAILKFNPSVDHSYSCISNSLDTFSEGVLFELKSLGDRKRSDYWKVSNAKIDFNCISNRGQSNCNNNQNVIPDGHFCVIDHNLNPPPGSSGGPFLLPLSNTEEDIWTVAGVLSYSTNETLCIQHHYIYTDITSNEMFEWILTNALSQNCGIGK